MGVTTDHRGVSGVKGTSCVWDIPFPPSSPPLFSFLLDGETNRKLYQVSNPSYWGWG